MKVAFTILCVLIWECTVPGNVYSQTIRKSDYPRGNEAVGIDKFEWLSAEEEKPPVAVRFTIRNKAKDKNIVSVQFTVVASDKKMVTLQQNGVTLRKLIQKTMIEPDQTETFYFEKAFTIPQVANIILKEIIVEYSNGSLEILNQ